MKAIDARFDGLEGKIDEEFKAVRSEITRLDQEIDSVDKRIDAARRLAVVEHPIEPGRLVRPHTHALEDEISHIEGEIGARIGDREFVARPGSWV